MNKLALYSKAVLGKFYTLYPEAKVTIINMGWAEALNQQFMNSAKANTLPDVFLGETYVPTYMDSDLLLELDIEKNIVDDLYPNTYKPYTKNNKIYGVPVYTGVYSLIYNKQILEGAGVMPDKQVPKTWDELLVNCQAVAAEYETSKGEIDVGGMLVNCGGPLNASFYALPWLRQVGAEYVDERGNITFNEAKAIPAYKYIRQLAKTAPVHSIDLSEDALNNIFLNNKAAYRLAGPWEYSAMTVKQKENFGSCELPLPTGGIESNVIVGNLVATLTKNCTNKKMSNDFINILLDKEIQYQVIDTYSRLSVLKSVCKDPKVVEAKPYLAPFIKGLDAENNKGGLPAFTKNSQRIWNNWQSSYYSILSKNNDIKIILDELQSKCAGLNK